MKCKKIIIYLLAVCMLPAASTVWAGPIMNMNFNNEFETDAIYLFLLDTNRTFENVYNLPDVGGNSWETIVFEPNSIVMRGDTLNPGQGSFGITFSRGGGFTLEWAEMLGGTINESGTLTFSGSGNVTSQQYGAITSPVPIPEGFWLLGSGLLCFFGIRRKQYRTVVRRRLAI